MPRQSNGVYVAPSNTSAVSGATISSTAFNSLETDIGNEVTNSVDRLGRSAMQANLPMAGYLINALGTPLASTDGANKAYVDAITTAINTYTVTPGTGLTGGGIINTSPTLSIAAGGVGTTQLAAASVTTAKIATANVTPTLLSQPFTAANFITVSGTTTNFASIPAWVKRISIIFSAVSFSGGGDALAIQIGPSGGVETTGYSGSSIAVGGGSNNIFSSSFQSVLASTTAGYGKLELVNLTGNTWVLTGMLSYPSSTNIINMAGVKVTASVLSQLTIKGNSGGTFNAGAINIFYE